MIIITLTLCILFIIASCIIYSRYKKQKGAISFRDSMRLTELPIVSFDDTHGNILNFLLDTGSNWSHINKKLITENKISYKKANGTIGVYGMDGIKRENNLCTIKLLYNNNAFEDDFQINDLEDAFNSIKQESGVTVHGIIGTHLMNKYNYLIDFKNLKCYTK